MFTKGELVVVPGLLDGNPQEGKVVRVMGGGQYVVIDVGADYDIHVKATNVEKAR